MLFAKGVIVDEDIDAGGQLFRSLVSRSAHGLTSCIIRREKYISSNLNPIYALEVSSNIVLWGQRSRNNSYIISGNKNDISLSRDRRSKLYIGKLKTVSQKRIYIGFNEYKGLSKKEIVSIIYDHERSDTTDRKMEVAIPIISESIPLHSVYMNARHEGAQNHIDTEKIVIMMQRIDVDTSNPLSLHEFHGQAILTSTKNFQLVISPPARMRDSRVIPEHILEIGLDASTGETRVLLQLGKFDSETFFCQISPPLSILQAFMICLSRFDTTQRY